ncbi:hypothetical protein MPS_3436 [Mycobacterium pseudoshottsii JCM 15466]|nr:hypothetical protein MMSP_2918 [Mycobacterium sp. 012931]GAQ37058.1 hypothetical protein MPS_3436 [Mycobacterium pseudoshottsii JCM 15466]
MNDVSPSVDGRDHNRGVTVAVGEIREPGHRTAGATLQR